MKTKATKVNQFFIPFLASGLITLVDVYENFQTSVTSIFFLYPFFYVELYFLCDL